MNPSRAKGLLFFSAVDPWLKIILLSTSTPFELFLPLAADFSDHVFFVQNFDERLPIHLSHKSGEWDGFADMFDPANPGQHTLYAQSESTMRH